MPDPEHIEYIKTQLSQGTTIPQIRTMLSNSGWTENDMNLAFEQLSNPIVSTLKPPPPPPAPPPPASPIAPGSNSMWDAFEHILLFISLYVMATAISLLLHFFVDKWFPGVSNTDTYAVVVNAFSVLIVNGYLAALIVSTPLFSFFFLQIQKRTISNPAIKALRARRILIYITLIATFILMVIQVVGVVFNLLNGNFTLNFVLHFIVTVGISSIIFAYYLFQIKEAQKAHA